MQKTRRRPSETELQFQAAFERMPVGVAHVDGDGRILRANPRLLDITGRPREELLGLRLEQLVPGDDLKFARRHAQRLLDGETDRCSLEMRVVRPGGRLVPARLSLSLQRDAAGRLEHFIAVVDEPASPDHGEAALLRRQEGRLRRALDAARMDVFEYEPATGRASRQGPLGRLLGLPPEAPGSEFFELIHPEDRPRFFAAQESLGPGRPGYTVEFRVQAPDGSCLWLVDQARGQFDERGRLVRLVGVCTDLTQRKGGELALARERELMKRTLDSIPVMLSLFDPRQQRVTLNRHFEAVLGWSTADANEGGFLERLYPDPAERAGVLQFLRSAEPGWKQWETRAKDGTRIPGEWTRVSLSEDMRLVIGWDLRQRRSSEELLARHAERQALLLELSTTLLRTGDDEEGLARYVFERIGAHLDADLCLNYRVDTPSGMLHLVAGLGIPTGRLSEWQWRQRGQSLCGTVAATTRTLAISKPQVAGHEKAASLRSLGGRAYVGHPLLGRDGRLLGTFALASTRREAFSPDEIEFFQTVCHFIALAWKRLQFDRELRQREQQYRMALDAGRLGTWRREILDSDRFHLDPRAQAHYGFEQADVPVSDMIARVHPEDRPRLEQAMAGSKSGARAGEGSRLEYRVILPDGSERWLEVHARLVLERRDSASVLKCIGTSADITERKRCELALQEAMADLRRAQSMARMGSWRLDADRRLRCGSEEAHRVLGIPEGKPLDHDDLLLRVHPEDRERVDACWRAALADGAPYSIEHRIRVGSQVKWLRQEAELRFDGQGELVSGFATVQDITERKQQEEALRRAAEELSAAHRSKDEFLATLTHELRNPLGPLRNAARLLRFEGLGPAHLAWSAQVIDRQVSHLARLIDDMADLSRVTHQKLELRRQPVALREVIDRALEGSAALIERHRHELKVELPAGDVVLEADPVRLVQVFQNLLDNAAKYTPAGGRIELLACLEGDAVAVSVRDSGLGISAASLARLFEMFYQVDRGAGHERSGLGIGLTLVQRLVQMHGGTIEACSDGEGRGSTFVVRLPVLQVPPCSEATPEPGHGAKPARLRLLVVDDNVDAAESTALLLELQGHEVHRAHDGLQAVREAERLRPDLVLLDIGMPGLDGFEVARRIRASDWGGRVLLVAQTGWGQQDDLRRTREAGFDAHLVKPVDPEALGRLLATAVPAGA